MLVTCHLHAHVVQDVRRMDLIRQKLTLPENASAVQTIKKVDKVMAMQGKHLAAEFNHTDAGFAGGVSARVVERVRGTTWERGDACGPVARRGSIFTPVMLADVPCVTAPTLTPDSTPTKSIPCRWTWPHFMRLAMLSTRTHPCLELSCGSPPSRHTF